MNFVLEKVERYMSEHHMVPAGSHVVVGVSGGADSMCLLFVLMNLMEKWALKLTVVHINHQIRGEAGDKDQQFVENFCKEHNLMCVSFSENIPAMAKREHVSEEEAGRMFRYACFESVAGDEGIIAVAHNKNDVTETMLLNMFRGTGLKGLCGIPKVRDRVVRPLLCLERSEIEDFLEKGNVSFCTDQTNLTNDYTRNKVRNVILPYVSDEINSGARENLLRLSEQAQEAVDYIQRQQARAWEEVCLADGSLDIQGLKALDPVICREVILRKICETAGSRKDIGRVHVLAVESLLDNSVGKQVSLPYGVTAVRRYDCLAFFAGEPVFSHEEDGAPTLSYRVFDWEENQRIDQNAYTKWLDYDKIKNGLILRHRCSGDYMVIDSKGSKKLLRRIMIDDKVLQEDRDNIWCVADGDHVVWMIGGRISEAYKVTSKTKRVLEITIKGEKDND